MGRVVLWIPVARAARMMGLSRSRVYALIRKGRLQAEYPETGGHLRVLWPPERCLGRPGRPRVDRSKKSKDSSLDQGGKIFNETE